MTIPRPDGSPGLQSFPRADLTKVAYESDSHVRAGASRSADKRTFPTEEMSQVETDLTGASASDYSTEHRIRLMPKSFDQLGEFDDLEPTFAAFDLGYE